MIPNHGHGALSSKRRCLTCCLDSALVEKVKDSLQQFLENRDSKLHKRRNEMRSLRADYKACLEKLDLQENKIRQNEAIIEYLMQNSVKSERIAQMDIMINELAFLHRKKQPGRRV